MPTYEYYCEACNKSFALFLSLSDAEKKKIACPDCKSRKVKRQISTFQTVTSKKS